jgi:hypothetical protein
MMNSLQQQSAVGTPSRDVSAHSRARLAGQTDAFSTRQRPDLRHTGKFAVCSRRASCSEKNINSPPTEGLGWVPVDNDLIEKSINFR